MTAPLRAPAPLLALLCLAWLLPLWGCDQPSGTGGQAVHFDLVVRGAPQGAQPLGVFTTATGWDVTLEAAYVTVGPLYLYADAPAALASLARPPAWTLGGALRALWLPTALAHAGDQHFSGGRVMGEALQQHVIDLLDPAGVTLASARGVGGEARSMSLWLLPPKASALGPVDAARGYTAYVVGEARKDEVVVRFEGGLTLPEEEQQRLVAGVAANLTLTDGARALVEVAPDAWLLDAHFERLDAADPDTGRLLLQPNTQPYNAWVIGVRSARAFRVGALTP